MTWACPKCGREWESGKDFTPILWDDDYYDHDCNEDNNEMSKKKAEHDYRIQYVECCMTCDHECSLQDELYECEFFEVPNKSGSVHPLGICDMFKKRMDT
jgi:predicted metal-binding protein